MGVRVALLQRAARGVRLVGLRLTSQTSDDAWTTPHVHLADDADPADLSTHIPQAAHWIARTLQGPRTTDALELLLLDDDGTTCNWLSTASLDDQIVGVLARSGTGVDDLDPSARPATTPVEFFAPSPLESTVQALAAPTAHTRDTPHPKPPQRAAKTSKSQRTQEPPRRVAVLATHDALAQTMLDALDRERVRVGSVATLWHALCLAWDPRSASMLRESHITRAASSAVDPLVQTPAVPANDALAAIVCVLSDGRLLWSWSRAGRLVASGSHRLRLRRLPQRNQIMLEDDRGHEAAPRRESPIEPTHAPVLTSDDAARIINDWLAWSAQLSCSPASIHCAFPELLAQQEDATTQRSLALSSSQFCEVLASRWPADTGVQAAVVPDPLGATLARCAKVLDATPRPDSGMTGEQALVALSQRPGRPSRRMHRWAATGIVMLGVGLAMLGARKLGTARDADKAALAWTNAWREKVREVYPDALTPPPTVSPRMMIEDEIRRRSRTSERPRGLERPKPVLRELELVSLVLASPTVELKRIDIDGASIVAVEAVLDSTSEAEALLEALRRVGPSELESWALDLRPLAERRTARYTARWRDRGAAP